MIGMHTSSVAPGYTVDSKTTVAPRLRFLPTEVLAPTSGEKSGACASSTGVGTATTMKSASFKAAGSLVGISLVDACSCSVLSSPVGSTQRR